MYEFGPGRRSELATDPDAWQPKTNRSEPIHYARLKLATEDGIVMLAGRSPDGVGPAFVVFEAENEEVAQRFMEDDPFVSEGLFTATLHRFNVALIGGV